MVDPEYPAAIIIFFPGQVSYLVQSCSHRSFCQDKRVISPDTPSEAVNAAALCPE